MTSGERIKALRIQKNMSQEELGAKVGLKKAAINKYETGLVVNYKRSVIASLAKALDCSPTYIMGFDDDPVQTSGSPLAMNQGLQKERFQDYSSRKSANFSDRLKELMRIKGCSQSDISRSTGISASSISHYVNGHWEGKQDVIYAIATIYGIDEAWLMGYDVPMEKKAPPPSAHAVSNFFADSEIALITRYRALDTYGRDAVSAVLDVEERRVAQAETHSDKAIEAPEDSAPKTRMIPLYRPAAGAGGITDISEDYEVPADSKADFAIKVSGDSMEPYLMDGEIYFGHKGIPKDGDVVAVLINGEYFVKLFTYNKRAAYFISANPLREDTNRTVWLDGQDRVQRIGIIDTPEKVPMP